MSNQWVINISNELINHSTLGIANTFLLEANNIFLGQLNLISNTPNKEDYENVGDS